MNVEEDPILPITQIDKAFLLSCANLKLAELTDNLIIRKGSRRNASALPLVSSILTQLQNTSIEDFSAHALTTKNEQKPLHYDMYLGIKHEQKEAILHMHLPFPDNPNLFPTIDFTWKDGVYLAQVEILNFDINPIIRRVRLDDTVDWIANSSDIFDKQISQSVDRRMLSDAVNIINNGTPSNDLSIHKRQTTPYVVDRSQELITL